MARQLFAFFITDFAIGQEIWRSALSGRPDRTQHIESPIHFGLSGTKSSLRLPSNQSLLEFMDANKCCVSALRSRPSCMIDENECRHSGGSDGIRSVRSKLAKGIIGIPTVRLPLRCIEPARQGMSLASALPPRKRTWQSIISGALPTCRWPHPSGKPDSSLVLCSFHRLACQC